MNVDEPFEELRGVLGTRMRSDVMTPDCLSDAVIAGLVDGSMDATHRDAALRHLASCGRCRSAVASVARALLEPAVAEAIADTDQRPRRWLRLAVPLAAAAVLLLLMRAPVFERGGEHRGGGTPLGLAPVPVSPVGPVAAVHVLVWTMVAGADAYRVTLFDAAGRVAYETRGTDTTAVLPDSVVLISGTPYLWKVEARTGFDRWVTSRLVEFSIAAPGPPVPRSP